MKYQKKYYTAEQKAWCQNYHASTTFEPMMDDYEAGNVTFVKAAQDSIDWFESWAIEARQKAEGDGIPGWMEEMELELDDELKNAA